MIMMIIMMMMMMNIMKMEINETQGVHRRTGFDSDAHFLNTILFINIKKQ